MRGEDGLRRDVRHVLSLARKLRDLLSRSGVAPVYVNRHSNIVVFPRPADPDLVRRWQLSTQGDVAHIVVMPSMEMDLLEAFVRDYVASREAAAGAAGQDGRAEGGRARSHEPSRRGAV